MTEQLKFKWLNKRKINKSDISLISENSFIGYILEADLEYPDELHELHNDYPLSAETPKISHNMLSNYCSSFENEYDIKNGGVNKLVPSLGNKSKYCLRYRNLQLYLSLGMKLTNFHRVLEFEQSDWLRKYIDFNTDKRKSAANTFEKYIFKLMNNNVYGKAMKNIRKGIKVSLVNDAKDYKNMWAKQVLFYRG